MNTFLFFLKTIGVCVGISAIAGIIAGLVMIVFVPEHPHQIVPTPVLMGMLAVIIGFAVSLVMSIILAIAGKTDWIYATVWSCGISILGIIIFLLKGIIGRS